MPLKPAGDHNFSAGVWFLKNAGFCACFLVHELGTLMLHKLKTKMQVLGFGGFGFNDNFLWAFVFFGGFSWGVVFFSFCCCFVLFCFVLLLLFICCCSWFLAAVVIVVLVLVFAVVVLLVDCMLLIVDCWLFCCLLLSLLLKLFVCSSYCFSWCYYCCGCSPNPCFFIWVVLVLSLYVFGFPQDAHFPCTFGGLFPFSLPKLLSSKSFFLLYFFFVPLLLPIFLLLQLLLLSPSFVHLLIFPCYLPIPFQTSLPFRSFSMFFSFLFWRFLFDVCLFSSGFSSCCCSKTKEVMSCNTSFYCLS